MPRVVLVDLRAELVDAARACGWSGIKLLPHTDVREVSRNPGTAFVSPANSLGFMDGGIDFVLSRVMFPGVEANVRRAFAALRETTLLGRPYCPIGRAVTVPTGARGVSLIAAPTMWLPQDVRGTHNAYHAMYAALREAAKDPSIDTLVVPGLCTGWGGMSAEEAVAQMRAAHDDFLGGRDARYYEIDDEQPTFYENTEFKRIDPAHVRRRGSGADQAGADRTLVTA